MRVIYIFLFMAIDVFLLSCTKEKMDQHRMPAFDHIASSTARLVLVDGQDIVVNQRRLTNAGETLPGTSTRMPIPTKYFPEKGTPGNTYFIPQEFIDGDRKATVRVGIAAYAEMEIHDNNVAPWDYYLSRNRLLSDELSLIPVPRPIATPISPQNTLVRLVNLSAADAGNTNEGETLSLAYADGSFVNPKTSGIASGKWSEYVEIPYGTYEFRVLVDDSHRQCPAVPPIQMGVESPAEPTIRGTNRYFTQRRTFLPGGVYTIAVTGNFGDFEANTAPVPINAFSVVTDAAPEANRTYGRIQFVNAFSKESMNPVLNGWETRNLAFGEAGGYHIVSAGQQDISLKGSSSETLLQQSLAVKGGDNLTLWLYPDREGHPQLHIAQNNMGGLVNLSDNADGAGGATSIYDPLDFADMNIQTRFFNFCPDLDYVTFTGRNGQSLGRPIERASGAIGYSEAASNLQLGLSPDVNLAPYPYINISPEEIQVYRSRPGTLPGNRMFDVAAVGAEQFIRIPASFYPTGWPLGEAGVYSVALIGRHNADEKARMIVIKHNQ